MIEPRSEPEIPPELIPAIKLAGQFIVIAIGFYGLCLFVALVWILRAKADNRSQKAAIFDVIAGSIGLCAAGVLYLNVMAQLDLSVMPQLRQVGFFIASALGSYVCIAVLRRL